MPNQPVTTMHTNLHQTNKRQKWWLPVIGPTATVLTQTLARYTPPDGVVWDLAELRLPVSARRSRAAWDGEPGSAV